jgi:hypothetical protein
MSEKETKEGGEGVTAADVLGTMVAAAETLKVAEGLLPGKKGSWGDTWEARDRAREERELKEYESIQAHRKAIERQNDESHAQYIRNTDLHAASNADNAAWNKENLANQKESLELFKRQVAALEGIASALKK